MLECQLTGFEPSGSNRSSIPEWRGRLLVPGGDRRVHPATRLFQHNTDGCTGRSGEFVSPDYFSTTLMAAQADQVSLCHPIISAQHWWLHRPIRWVCANRLFQRNADGCTGRSGEFVQPDYFSMTLMAALADQVSLCYQIISAQCWWLHMRIRWVCATRLFQHDTYGCTCRSGEFELIML